MGPGQRHVGVTAKEMPHASARIMRLAYVTLFIQLASKQASTYFLFHLGIVNETSGLSAAVCASKISKPVSIICRKRSTCIAIGSMPANKRINR